MKSGGGIKRAPRIRLPSREELALWRHATADVRPREEKAPAPEDTTQTPPIPVLAEPKAEAPSSSRVGAAPSAPNEQRKSSPPALAPLAPLERRLKRRLTSGKAQVDDVLDLHGLTQAQAHRRLNQFLWRSAENGAKLVLIITGKGAAITADESVMRSNAGCCAAIRHTGFARPNCGPLSFRSKSWPGPMEGRAHSMFASGVACVADEST